MARSEVISLSGIENICIGVSLAMTASVMTGKALSEHNESALPLKAEVRVDIR
jgi:hypothetical protein